MNNFLKCEHLQICEQILKTHTFCKKKEFQTFFLNENWNKIERENIYSNYEQFFGNRIRNYNSPNIFKHFLKSRTYFEFKKKSKWKTILKNPKQFEVGTNFEYVNKNVKIETFF